MKKILYTLFTVFYLSTGFGQDIEIEKTYEISGKAKRGNLSQAIFDEKSGNYVLTYVTKATTTKAKFEIFSFDKDFNFISTENHELEFKDAKLKYPWWNFKVEETEVIGNIALPNLTGQLVVRKVKIKEGYDWYFGIYLPRIETLEKVKPKSDKGEKYYFLSSATNHANGELYTLSGLKNEQDKYSRYKNIHFLKFNNDLDVIKDLEIKFDYPQGLVNSLTITDKDENLIELVYLFAPVDEGTPDPEKNRYTFIRLNSKLEIIDNIPVKSNSAFWAVNEIVVGNNPDEFIIYGPCYDVKDKYFEVLTDVEIEKTKFDAFQVMKISDHKIAYITKTNFDEFEAKNHTPPNQKKAPEYKGKKFELDEALVLENGDLLIVGQNWGGKFNAISGNRELAYKDIIGFHFSNTGTLRSQFGIDTKENNGDFPTPQIVFESNNKENVYWIIQEVKGEKGKGIGFQLAGMSELSSLLKKRLLTYPTLGKINLKSSNISEFKVYGGEKYFSDNNFPYIRIPNENKITMFGADKSGNTIWFARIRID